jgi:O-6-methylguanine DNA methyltransferase
LKFSGSEFQKKVWQALLRIPYGETKSYKNIAEEIGIPRGSRAVGMACNRNPISIVVPCHRVIGSDGKLVGYNGGLGKKEFLLAMEKSRAGS